MTDADRPSDRVQPTPLTWQGWLRVWALWLVLTTIGGLAGLGLAAYLEGFAVVSGWLPWEIQTGIALTAAGAGMGFGQWLLLQPWVHKAWQWIVPTVAGQPLGWAAAVAVSWHYDAWVLIWVVSGIGQWLVLCRWVHRSWWWLIAAVSYAPLRWLIDRTGLADVEVWGQMLVFGTPVALTGLILMLLFAQSARREQLKASTRGAGSVFQTCLWAMLILVLGVVSGLALLAVGLILLFGGGGCNEQNPIIEVTSPDGRYVARSRFENCGGATGGVHSVVTIRDVAGPYLNDPESIAVVFGDYSWDLRIRWSDARTLVVDYGLRSKNSSERRSLTCKDWRDIEVTCPVLTPVPKNVDSVDSTPVSTERGVTTIPDRKLLFIETFESPEAGKLPQASPDPARFQAGYEDGEYVIRLTKPAKGTLVRIGLPGIHTDVNLGVDAWLARGTDDAVIVLGCRVNSDYREEYRLRIDPARSRFILTGWIDGEETHYDWHYYTQVSPHAWVNPLHGPNRVRLTCGWDLNVYVNERWSLSVVTKPPPTADSEYSPEGGIWIGVEVVSGSAADVEARFDNLEVASGAVR